MTTHTEIMRNLIDLLWEVAGATQSPLEKYLHQFPDAVGKTQQELLDILKREADQGERFQWAIAQLPDGRFIQAFPSVIKKFGLTPIKQGNQDTLY